MLVVLPDFPWGHRLFFIKTVEEWRKRLKSLVVGSLYPLPSGDEALHQELAWPSLHFWEHPSPPQCCCMRLQVAGGKS